MNLPVIITKALAAAKHLCGNGWLLAKKHAPEIMIGTGIVGFGATVYETVKATNKTNDILEEKEGAEARYAGLLEFADYTMDDLHDDLKTLKRKTRWRIAKAWFPVITLGGGSIVCVLGGYKIINGRYVATVAAYKFLEAETNRYRENVIERYGEQVDWELANDIKAEKLEAALKEREENDKIAEENKKKKIRKTPPKTAYQDIHSRIFDPHSERWQRYWTPDLVLEFLQTAERQLTDKGRLQGHLFENEINDYLGLPRTPEGAVCGLLFDKNHPNTEVDIGIRHMPEEEIRRIMCIKRNEDISVRLHYNTHGIIYNEI